MEKYFATSRIREILLFAPYAFDVFHFYAAKNFESLVSNMNLIIRRKSYFLNRRDSPIEHLFGLKTIFIDSCNSVNLNELI